MSRCCSSGDGVRRVLGRVAGVVVAGRSAAALVAGGDVRVGVPAEDSPIFSRAIPVDHEREATELGGGAGNATRGRTATSAVAAKKKQPALEPMPAAEPD
jgi:hypothetical protein